MKPGATTRPSASIVRSAAAPFDLPTPTILPSLTATSAWNAGSPEPSTTRPFLMSRSNAIAFPPAGRCAVALVDTRGALPLALPAGAPVISTLGLWHPSGCDNPFRRAAASMLAHGPTDSQVTLVVTEPIPAKAHSTRSPRFKG